MCVSPWLASPLEPLALSQNAASLSFLYSYYFGRCSSELILLAHSLGSSTHYSNRLYDFLSPFLDVIRMPTSIVSFLAHLDPGILSLQNAFLWPISALLYDFNIFLLFLVIPCIFHFMHHPCMKWKKLKNGSKFYEKSPSFASSRKVVLLIKIKIKIKILVVNIFGIFEFKFCLEFLDTKTLQYLCLKS